MRPIIPLSLAALGLGLGLGGCPDTSLPPFGGAGRTRVCTIEELLAFQTAGFQEERDELWIAFVDVGQGDATWIRTPGVTGVDAQEIIIDAGDCRVGAGDCGIISNVQDSSPDGIGALLSFMSGSGLPPGLRIDTLVVTHPDKDHYGGAWTLLDRYDVATYVDPGFEPKLPLVTYQALLNKVGQEPGITVLRPAELRGLDPSRNTGLGDRVTWGRGLTATLLSADQNAVDDNASSIVILLEYLGVRILLAADSMAPLDAKLAALGPAVQAQVLRAGHHGGDETSTQPFLDAVFPPTDDALRFAIISVGRSYGHPVPDTVDRLLAKVGPARLYRTDRADSHKSAVEAPGDDHILLRVSREGELTVCYAFPDRG